MSVFLYSQTQTTQVEANTETQLISNESDFIISNDSVGTNDSTEVVETEGTGSVLWLFIRMVFALVLVVALIYGIVYVLKKGFVSKEAENPFLKKAATLTLAPGKTVQVITMPDKAWVVGVTDAGINLIGEITDVDLVNQMILEAEKEPLSKPRDFASILSSFTNTTKVTELAIKKQRERLQRGGNNE